MDKKTQSMLLSSNTLVEFAVIGIPLYFFPYMTLLSVSCIGGYIYVSNNFFKSQSKNLLQSNPNYLMKAIEYSTYEKGKFIMNESADIPKYSSNEVLIQVKGAAINPVDYKVMTPFLPFVRWFMSHNAGRDVSGIVLATGSSVTKFKAGDEVYGNSKSGSLAEYCVCNSDQIAKKANKLSFTESASLALAGGTSLQSLKYNGSLVGKRVLVIGASGGCGSLGVQLAKALGAEKVTGVCSKNNVDFVKSLGADQIVDYTDPEFLTKLENSNEKFDLIYDTVTSPEDSNQEVIFKKFLNSNGKVVAINGGPSDWIKAFTSKIYNVERDNYHLLLLNWNTEDLELMAKFSDENKLKVEIADTYKLDVNQVGLAFEKLKGRRTRGKICFEI